MKLLVVSAMVAATLATHCTARGGCDCDCSWANPSTCNNDDGSCCWGCCCGAHPSPSPPTPSPPSPPPPSGLTEYCPTANDLTIAYTVKQPPSIYDGGWSIQGGGAVATKSAFNLLGGSVEYDIDTTKVHPGVNCNIYTISPHFNSSQFNQNIYCDGAATGDKWCVEVDWIESNGNCGGATTLHTKEGPGSDGCTAWGCRESYHYGGQTSFHMKIEYGTDGAWTTIRDGQTIAPSNLSPVPNGNDWMTLRSFYEKNGAVVYSSQWVGWVPVTDCGSSGDLDSSFYQVKNLKITGAVVQGPEPTKCNQTVTVIN